MIKPRSFTLLCRTAPLDIARETMHFHHDPGHYWRLIAIGKVRIWSSGDPQSGFTTFLSQPLRIKTIAYHKSPKSAYCRPRVSQSTISAS